MHKIETTVAETLRKAGISSVLVAVSGGADSVALLRACAHLSPMLGLRLEAVNCNFHLRGAESDRDSEFVAALCRQLGVKLHLADYDVMAYITEHPGTSMEMACRELRYSDFFRICREENLERVAVAHNTDDDLETMIMNMLRGSGTRGLRGMDIDNGRVIRPFLKVTRKEIESYLSAIGQDFITDSSNLTSDYRRNFIRRDVLPLLESRWPGARKSLTKTLSIMKEESDIIEAHYRRQLAELSPDTTTLLVYANGVTTGTILRFIEPFGGNTSVAVDIKDSLSGQYGERRWKLSERYTAVLERDRLIVIDREASRTEPTIHWKKLTMTPEVMTEIKSNKDHHTIYLPNDERAYELRPPRKGDRMAPLGMKGTRLVSDIISDARLDHRQKDAVRILARRSDGEIIWVTGLKRSRHDLISTDSEYACKAVYIPAGRGI
ncbi:MAG: tRNA lysidine(34) synthetase TilS [Muribaculaceae bacterium]|nr:tRNA lysidine(34) synthetase TilS [Muribaculaceae bacterium]